jgi:hydroxymethylpyrimidine pyrophosphatase-like HAD family hydrolase
VLYCTITPKKVIASDPLQPEQATQLVNLLDSYNVHSLMYADDAMFYQNPTGHIIRTENWAKSLPESQRPVFKQVPSLVKHLKMLMLYGNSPLLILILKNYIALVRS